MSTLNRHTIDPRTAAYGATALRLILAVVFLFAAYKKFFIFTLAGTSQFFAAQGFPGWTAYIVAPAELIAGLALLTGFQARWAALALIPTMLGALKVHAAAGWSFGNPGGGAEYIVVLLVALLAQGLLGNGAFALRLPSRKTAPTPAVATA